MMVTTATVVPLFRFFLLNRRAVATSSSSVHCSGTSCRFEGFVCGIWVIGFGASWIQTILYLPNTLFLTYPNETEVEDNNCIIYVLTHQVISYVEVLLYVEL
ncbi:hypothetical protein L1987_37612 [Smallanthus sonchifolius]|uniref:Uncharacterized protein n=1 Tax=Smallanthus sonchifolius TaxID=185202 RepID=A0ACB9HGX3_9ASTR|nr:hypothetical protein L1987_37612 [Smallanthus sonchifolius]